MIPDLVKELIGMQELKETATIREKELICMEVKLLPLKKLRFISKLTDIWKTSLTSLESQENTTSSKRYCKNNKETSNRLKSLERTRKKPF